MTMNHKSMNEYTYQKPVLPAHYHQWDETDSAYVDQILSNYGPVKKMSLEEIRTLTKERMGERRMSDVIREMRDEGY